MGEAQKTSFETCHAGSRGSASLPWGGNRFAGFSYLDAHGLQKVAELSGVAGEFRCHGLHR